MFGFTGDVADHTWGCVDEGQGLLAVVALWPYLLSVESRRQHNLVKYTLIPSHS